MSKNTIPRLGILVIVLCACAGPASPEVTPTPCTRDMMVICELPDGSGVLMATHVSQTPDGGWKVQGDILVVPQSGDAYTIPGPTEIAPGSQCVVID